MSVSKVFLMFASVAALAACASRAPSETPADRDPANMSGVNYNVGSYACEDREQGLSSRFTFGAPSATLVVKGAEVPLTCGRDQISPRTASLFEYVRPVDVCTGKMAKGSIVAGTMNSMGSKQMRVFLLDSSGTVKARSIMNCVAARAETDGGW